ncbi:MAG: nucleoside hydrolase, partial [Oscillospiraceae bacterium]|nr:nucleoside hydrolase [Oscillospiraceae bacterium]
MLNKRPIIMDVDTGVDDTLAFLLAAAADNLDIRAITTVFGNCAVDVTTKNTLKICELFGLDVPVARGTYRPVIDPPIDYSVAPMVDIHGRDGLGNVGDRLPEPTKQVEAMAAADLMAKAIKECDEKMTIVATGPLTNIATFLLAYPDLHEKIECIAFMGGAAFGGN